MTSPLCPASAWDDYEKALADARSILTRQLVPLPAYASVCKLCHWYTHCVPQLTAADDLTLIPFLGRSDRDTMSDRYPRSRLRRRAIRTGSSRARKRCFAASAADRFRSSQARAAMLKASPPEPYLRAADKTGPFR